MSDLYSLFFCFPPLPNPLKRFGTRRPKMFNFVDLFLKTIPEPQNLPFNSTSPNKRLSCNNVLPDRPCWGTRLFWGRGLLSSPFSSCCQPVANFLDNTAAHLTLKQGSLRDYKVPTGLLYRGSRCSSLVIMHEEYYSGGGGGEREGADGNMVRWLVAVSSAR